MVVLAADTDTDRIQSDMFGHQAMHPVRHETGAVDTPSGIRLLARRLPRGARPTVLRATHGVWQPIERHVFDTSLSRMIGQMRAQWLADKWCRMFNAERW